MAAGGEGSHSDLWDLVSRDLPGDLIKRGLGIRTPSLDPSSAGTQEPTCPGQFSFGDWKYHPRFEETESQNLSKARHCSANLRTQPGKDHWGEWLTVGVRILNNCYHLCLGSASQLSL